jgi:hypothetical protein
MTAIDDLIRAAEAGRPTLGAILRENLIAGEVAEAEGEVRLVLRPLSEDDGVILEDPPSLAWLAGLPGSPGRWRVTYREPLAVMAARMAEAAAHAARRNSAAISRAVEAVGDALRRGALFGAVAVTATSASSAPPAPAADPAVAVLEVETPTRPAATPSSPTRTDEEAALVEIAGQTALGDSDDVMAAARALAAPLGDDWPPDERRLRKLKLWHALGEEIARSVEAAQPARVPFCRWGRVRAALDAIWATRGATGDVRAIRRAEAVDAVLEEWMRHPEPPLPSQAGHLTDAAPANPEELRRLNRLRIAAEETWLGKRPAVLLHVRRGCRAVAFRVPFAVDVREVAEDLEAALAAELRELVEAGRLADVPGFGEDEAVDGESIALFVRDGCARSLVAAVVDAVLAGRALRWKGRAVPPAGCPHGRP